MQTFNLEMVFFCRTRKYGKVREKVFAWFVRSVLLKLKVLSCK